MHARIFIKSHGADIQEDLHRLACLEAVCSATGLAITARVLRVDENRSEIWYAHLDGLEPLSLAAGQDVKCFYELGAMLAGMHRARPAIIARCERNLVWEQGQLALAGIKGALAAKVLDEFPVGFAHADLWHGNVLRREQEWVVLDPIPSGLVLRGISVCASGIFDLAKFHMSLLVRRQLRDYFSPIGRVASGYGWEFLRGYLDSCSAGWARGAVSQLSQSLASQWIAAYRGRMFLPVALLKQRMFVKNFSDYYAGMYEAS